jgi:hypothetical protein
VLRIKKKALREKIHGRSKRTKLARMRSFQVEENKQSSYNKECSAL